MDINEIKQIVTLMNENDLVEFELEEEGRKLRLKRRLHEQVASPLAQPIVVGAHGIAPIVPANILPAAEATRKAANTADIISPMPGTFYRAPSPNAKSFVEIGDRVKADTVICIIEAMKVMNEVRAEREGEVVDILVENGEAVEYGQSLFVLKALS